MSILLKKVGPGSGTKNFDFPLFLRGVLEKVVCRTWLFGGKNVVKCVVNVDGKLLVFDV
jgi:hypothetical protein